MWSNVTRRFRRNTEGEILPTRSSTMPSPQGESGVLPLDFLAMLESTPAPDVGEKQEDQERRRRLRPTLVEVGGNTGSSRVQYRGHYIDLHLLTKDFFISVIQIDTWWLFCLVAGVYLITFFVWSFFWWLVVRYRPGCLYGATNYVEALVFAVVTQMTIGYGNTGPQSCWLAAWLIIIQIIIAMIMEAIVLGVIFARISHPHQRSRSIFISNKAIIARRDGILKFMFRVADIRNAQVVEPKVKAYLYTWGDGRVTAEGERIPVRVEPLEVDYIDGMLLLPLIIEHTIDERSPLCGHTHASLASLSAEVVVTFEGTTEMGNPFMARRSYIPEEIFWGYQFINIVKRPLAGTPNQFAVELDRFHLVERQADMPDLHPVQLSNLVVNRAKRTVPYPLLGENTLVLSDVVCVAPNEDGQLCIMCRVGDTYPNQMLEITAKMYFYRWKDPATLRSVGTTNTENGTLSRTMTPTSGLGVSNIPGGGALSGITGDTKGDGAGDGLPGGTTTATGPEAEYPCQQFGLDCGYKDGSERLYLRLPNVITHVIDSDSPLAAWREPGGLEADVHSEIVVVINAYMNVNTHNILRQRTYAVGHHLRYGYQFANMVRHPALCSDRKPRVRWHRFHDIISAEGMDKFPRPPPVPTLQSAGSQFIPQMSMAPESHASQRSMNDVQQARMANMMRNDFTVLPGVDLQRYAAAVGGDNSNLPGSTLTGQSFQIPEALLRYAQNTLEASDSLPHPAAMHPALPGPYRFRQSDATDFNERSDYTVLPMDLQRYSMAVAGNDDDSLPHRRSYNFVPLPVDFKQSTAAAAAAAAGEGGSGGIPLPRTVSVIPEGGEQEGEGEVQGPLAGVHMAAGDASRMTEAADDEGTEAGPIHFVSSKDRNGGKSYHEISSLFSPEEDDDEDEEGGMKDTAASGEVKRKPSSGA